jgi:hypothetical protein
MAVRLFVDPRMVIRPRSGGGAGQSWLDVYDDHPDDECTCVDMFGKWPGEAVGELVGALSTDELFGLMDPATSVADESDPIEAWTKETA